MRNNFLLKIPKFCFSGKTNILEVFSPDYFLENYKKSLEKTGIFSIDLDEKTKLFGVPFVSFKETAVLDDISNAVLAQDPNRICLLQIDPSKYSYLKRMNHPSINEFFREKYVMKQEQMELLDFSLQETFVEEPLFDFLNKEKPSNFSITNYIRKFDKELTKAEEIVTKLHGSLLDFVMTEGILMNFPEFTNILILQILRNKNIYLADIPLNSYKIMLAKALNKEALIKSFEETIESSKKFGPEVEIFNIFSMLYGHYLQMPRDIYIYNFLRKIRKVQPKTDVSIFVEMPHFDSFQKYFKMMMNKQGEEETSGKLEITEELVGKLAILDVLFEVKSDKILEEKMTDFLKKQSGMQKYEKVYRESLIKNKDLTKSLNNN